LKWDGIEYENYDGLVLNKTVNNQCPNCDQYFFELEYRGNNADWVHIKNEASNKYINILGDNTFALNNKFSLHLIISNDDLITIRSWLFLWTWDKKIYLGSSSPSQYDDRINGRLSYYDSLKFTFVRTAYQSPRNNESSFKNIFSFYIILISIIFYQI
jgi:hypothetical protein